MSMAERRADFPLAARCACPVRGGSARLCYCVRYAPDDSEPKDEACECSCHERDEDEE